MKSLILSLLLIFPICLRAQDNVQTDDEPDIPYENLTPAEKKAAIQAIKGNYFQTHLAFR